MYHPPSKRKQLIRQVAVYTAMSVTVIVAVTALVLVMIGYNFNKKDGRIEQGGLIQFASLPSGAEVTVDGNVIGSQTPSKTTAFTGSHFVAMNKLGYKTWQKSVEVLPGSILWLNYARLIPTTLTPAAVIDFTTVSSTSSSPDKKWMAVKEDPATPDIRLVNIADDKTPVTTLSLPPASFTAPSVGKTQSFTLDTWDNAGRYVLVKHTYDDGKLEWIVVDSQDASKTKNITTLLGIDASKVVFHGSNNKIMIAQIGTDIRQIDLDAATLSRPLVTNVAEFNLTAASTITYVTNFDDIKKTRSVGYYKLNADAPVVLQSFNDATLPLHIAIGTYFSENFIAINYGDTMNIYKGTLPKTTIADSDLSTAATYKLDGGAQWLQIHTNGRFVITQKANVFTTYDIELSKVTTTTLKGETEATKELQWLDGYTVWSDKESVVRLYEFDGANQQDIMTVVPGYSVTLNPDGSYIYGINKSTAGVFQLQRVKLVL